MALAGMDVPHAWTYVSRIPKLDKGQRATPFANVKFQSSHISIQRSDRFDDVVEFRVAHMGVICVSSRTPADARRNASAAHLR